MEVHLKGGSYFSLKVRGGGIRQFRILIKKSNGKTKLLNNFHNGTSAYMLLKLTLKGCMYGNNLSHELPP